ncbi:MAG: DUF1622 domain-containing protein [bacterium]|nr:DUF1622 domain-containing protein [bacterium]MDT8367390.1 DUF1622 domain-containing protein [bacterium]
MDLLHRIIEVVSFCISLIGVLVVLWGTVETVFRFLKDKLGGVGTSIAMDASMRQELSAHLLLGLEIFIAADIISSVSSPTWEKVGILGAVVGIRTVLSYFLTIEMEKEKSITRDS